MPAHCINSTVRSTTDQQGLVAGALYIVVNFVEGAFGVVTYYVMRKDTPAAPALPVINGHLLLARHDEFASAV